MPRYGFVSVCSYERATHNRIDTVEAFAVGRIQCSERECRFLASGIGHASHTKALNMHQHNSFIIKKCC